MFQRVLWVSLTQVLRSVSVILLPMGFISLFAWATAGSSNGNTSDPIRATMWLWLGAHHIPFHLIMPPGGAPGFLSYLPIGAMLFPTLAIRSCYGRACERLDNVAQEKQLSRALFALIYAGFASLVAWGSTTTGVAPNLYWTPAITLAMVWISTVSSKAKVRKYEVSSLQISLQIVAIVTGVSAIVFGVDLFLNLKTVENLTTILQPGFVGGLLLLLLNLLYLPNAIVSTLSYLVGPGFAVGSHTLISPLTHRVSEIPALPFLGGLPTGRHPLVLLSIAVMVVMGAILYNVTIAQSSRIFIKSFLYILIDLGILSFLSSGSLITTAMSAVGVSAWQFTLAVTCEIGVGIILAMTMPRLLALVPRLRR